MIHNISYRTFVYSTEEEENVVKSLNYIFSEPSPVKTITEDHFGNKIFILSEKISKKRFTKDIVKFLNDNLSTEDKKIISDELSRRMDDKGNLFLRFDKQEAYDENLKLTYDGDAIHMRIKIASYPVSKKNATIVAKKIFNFLE
ncbi:RNA-binding domain-containing protein [Methanosphaera sp. BMS]|uniref:RNA-binding domain-containing protein n=1 Tax=Methanosphaera sp. BMS TaxID=1789762 RepID=UPI000DC1EF3F|nr:RNA-binding domain-containing protein [Methanosphaera sp. BMS]AWX33306.1 exosome protein [Methanosphaera sp. BMS]